MSQPYFDVMNVHQLRNRAERFGSEPSPSSVSLEARPARANTDLSRRSSSRFICIDTADCVLFTTSAALVKLPVSAMAMKVRNWSTSSRAVMGVSLEKPPAGPAADITNPDRLD